MTIGQRIKFCREQKNLTQTELAERTGTTKQNVYKYENGIITNIPSDFNFCKIKYDTKYDTKKSRLTI